jgi:hypothetical protein
MFSLERSASYSVTEIKSGSHFFKNIVTTKEHVTAQHARTGRDSAQGHSSTHISWCKIWESSLCVPFVISTHNPIQITIRLCQ